MSDISQADLIREDIEKKLKDNYDYSKSSFKQKAVNEFVSSNPELNTTFEKAKKSYYKILKEFEKSEGIQVASNKKKVLKVKSQMIHGDMDSTISPVPQQVAQSQLINQNAMNPNETSTPMLVNHDIEGVSASINAFYLVIKTIFAPEAELLSDEEKKSLGSIWLPIFNKYLQNEKSIILVAVASSVGIISPKLMKGRKLKKAKEPKKQEPTPKEKQLDPTLEKMDGFDA